LRIVRRSIDPIGFLSSKRIAMARAVPATAIAAVFTLTRFEALGIGVSGSIRSVYCPIAYRIRADAKTAPNAVSRTRRRLLCD